MIASQQQVVYLDEHFRSMPQIIAFSNRELYRDALEETVLVFHDLWDDEEGFQRHPRSEKYRDLLLVMEMAKEVPEVRFDEISHTSGLEAIERARA